MAKWLFKDIYDSDNVIALTKWFLRKSDEQDTVIYDELLYSIDAEWYYLANMGCSVIGDWSSKEIAMECVKCVFAETSYRYRQELHQIYDGLKRLTSTPSTDTVTREKTHSGNSAAMNETSPINAGATYDITTPNAKAKSEYSNSDTESVTNDTVDEAVARIKALNEYRIRLMDIAQYGLRACCDEFMRCY